MQEETSKLQGEILIRKNTHQDEPKPKDNIISNLQDYMKSKDNQVNDLKNENNELKKKIEELRKDNEKLKKENKQINLGNELSVFINSNDQKINCEIKCKENELFMDVEKKLYEKYNEYRDTNNSFIIGNRPVFRFKTIKENNIKDKDKIRLKKN